MQPTLWLQTAKFDEIMQAFDVKGGIRQSLGARGVFKILFTRDLVYSHAKW
jgi:hypothetical protein